jgi:WD40 repeat protein
MGLASRHVNEAGGMGLANELAQHWVPAAGDTDHRDWEWYLLRSIASQDRFTLKHPTDVNAVSWHPGSTHLASTTQDSITLWDASNGEITLVIPIDGGAVFPKVVWSPDGTRLATCGESIVVWSSLTGEKIAAMRGGWEYATDVSWHPDGTRLVSANSDDTISVWATRDGSELLNFDAKTESLREVRWGPDGQRFASGGQDDKIHVWDSARGNLLLTIGPVRHSCIAWNPNGATIAAIDGSGDARIIDAATGEQVATLKTGTLHTAISWSPDGSGIAGPANHHTVLVASTKSRAVIRELRGHSQRVAAVAWSPDGTRLASASADDSVKIWDLSSSPSYTRKLRHDISPTGKLLLDRGENPAVLSANTSQTTAELTGWPVRIEALAWHPDGTHVAAASKDHVITVWHTQTGSKVREMRGHTTPIRFLCFEPSGPRLASGSDDGEVRIWSPDKQAALQVLNDKSSAAERLAWGPDRQSLAVSYSSHTTLWNLEDETASDWIREDIFAWSPDGRFYALASSFEDQINIMDRHTGERISVLSGHTDHVESLAWSPNGLRLVSGGRDTTSKLWEPISGREILTLRGHARAVVSVSWIANGRALVTKDEGGETRLWDATSGYDREAARNKPLEDSLERRRGGNAVERFVQDPTIPPRSPLSPYGSTQPKHPLGPFDSRPKDPFSTVRDARLPPEDPFRQ